jgi:hypothetical protein
MRSFRFHSPDPDPARCGEHEPRRDRERRGSSPLERSDEPGSSEFGEVSRRALLSDPSAVPVRVNGHFTSEEKRKIFRGMVVAELEAGFLRYSKRQALIQYGTRLGLSEFDANLLIAEAQYHRNEIEPTGFLTPATLDALTRPERWSTSMRIAMALVVAIFIDLLLIRFVIH